ncbi:MAG: glycosyltransferase family 2 protein, partial [Bacteroidales bacterium]|nr:glycosyltransferase family 2 protein [Bacteroidales bacterium]
AGGFDISFFAHMEEIDLCWRFHSLGYKLMVCPQSVVYHVGGGTLSKANPRKTYLNFRNNQYLLYKNLPFKYRMCILPLRFVLDMLAAFVFLLKGARKDAIAVVKAHLHFWKAIPGLRKNKNPFPLQGRSYIGKKSLIWNYYVLGKKTYKALHGID